MIKLALLLLLAVPASAKKDDYAPLKGLYGNWTVDRDCRVMRDKILVEVVRLPNAVRASYYSTNKAKSFLGKSEIFYNAAAERYRVFTYLTGQAAQLLGNKAVPGALSVAGEDEEDAGLIRVTGKLSMVGANMEMRLHDGNTKANFSLRAQTPLGPQNCSGVGLKQPPKK